MQLEVLEKAVAKKIIEYLQTGKIEKFEELKKKMSYELLELRGVLQFLDPQH